MSRKFIRDMFGTLEAKVNIASGAQTDKEIIAAVTNRTIVIDYLEFSTDTKLNVFFEHGTTQLGAIRYVGADGGFILDLPEYRAGRGVSFTFTTSATAACSVYVQYHLEGFAI